MRVTERFASARLEDIRRSDNWYAIRRHFEIEAFGVNAWTASAGDAVIGEHSETTSGHQELYVVLDGHAEFTVDGETIDAPRGTLVFVRDADVRRGAVARDDGTTVLAVGAKAGDVFAPQGWEYAADAMPLFERGDYAGAKELLAEANERYPGFAGILYNLACAEARLGEADAALEHLNAAVARQQEFAGYAQTDEDLESIRADPRFPS